MTKYTHEQCVSLFWSRVNKNGSIPKHCPELGNCWEWTAALIKGYGTATVHGKALRTHRFSWMLTYGNIPEGLLVLHKCDNRKCVRPDHLRLGTNQDNMDDMWAKGRAFNKRGEEHWHHILTKAQVIEIRARYENGKVSASQLAKEYFVSRTNIKDIVNNKIWRWL